MCVCVCVCACHIRMRQYLNVTCQEYYTIRAGTTTSFYIRREGAKVIKVHEMETYALGKM